MTSNAEILSGPLPTFYDEARRAFLRDQGTDLTADGCEDVEEVCNKLTAKPLLEFLQVAFVYLSDLERGQREDCLPVRSHAFRQRVNDILADDQSTYKLDEQARVVIDSANEMEALRRFILLGRDEAAACQQGDVQIEMVASTVQPRLSQPGCVLMDYGLGLGRIFAGLSTAPRLAATTYIRVDEPIDPRARAVMTSGSAQFLTRTEYRKNPVAADVVIIVNTLHHIPFSEIAAQLGLIFSNLKPGGLVLIHEMGELRDPEPFNVPWRLEDILGLLTSPAFDVNPRSTISRGKKVPLSHVLVSVRDPALVQRALSENVLTAWARMKQRVLSDLRQLYKSRDPTSHLELQHALFLNANLDLNTPTE